MTDPRTRAGRSEDEACRAPLPVPAASPRPPLLLRRHHSHHGRHLRRLHRRHRRRAHRHLHQLPLPPPSPSSGCSPASRPTQPALLDPYVLQLRPREIPAALLPASAVAGDAVATCCACSCRIVGTPTTSRITSCLCCSRMAGCGYADEFGCRKPGERSISRKFKSGLLPSFQVALLAP